MMKELGEFLQRALLKRGRGLLGMFWCGFFPAVDC